MRLSGGGGGGGSRAYFILFYKVMPYYLEVNNMCLKLISVVLSFPKTIFEIELMNVKS